MNTTNSKKSKAMAYVLPAAVATATFGAVQDAEAVTEITTYGDLTVADFTQKARFDLNGDGLDDYEFQADKKTGFLRGMLKANASFRDGAYAYAFSAGDDVPGLNKIPATNYVELYSDGTDGPLGSVGDTMFVGLYMGVFDQIEEEFSYHFGWAEFERGSLTLLQTGFQTTPFASAQIPGAPAAVPVPGSLALLATGMVGLGGLRRRKKKAA